MTRVACAAALCACLALATAPFLSAAGRPRLVVLLVVDQMRNDYIEDYGGTWTKGLRRLLDEGARFRNGAFTYLNTVTCAGHATIGTGTVPAVHGVILNQWFHRDIGKAPSCTDDPASPGVLYGNATTAAGHSSKRLLLPTFAETLWRAQGERGTVVTMSLKARSAIMLAGARGDAVTWFEAPFWSTSKAYTAKPIRAVERFVHDNPVERDLGKTWTRVLPAGSYKYVDAGPGEKPTAGWTREFPHAIGDRERITDQFYEAWQQSPYSDAYLGRMAAAMVDDMHLGKDDVTDVLGVSFSALDLVGHDYGPRSHEVQDLLVRLDATIGRLIEHLDQKVGRDHYVLALSSDHGVAGLPEQLTAEGTDAGRVIMLRVVERVTKLLSDTFGGGRHVARMDYTSLYFTPGLFERIASTPGLLDQVMRTIRETPGVLAAYDGRSLDPKQPTDDPLARAAANSTYPGRSGDLVVIPKLNWFFVGDEKTAAAGGTTHGTSHPYDVRVPVVLLGAGVRRGTYDEPAAPSDIAPTLAAICGIPLPTATGRVLGEALVAPAARTTQAP